MDVLSFFFFFNTNHIHTHAYEFLSVINTQYEALTRKQTFKENIAVDFFLSCITKSYSGTVYLLESITLPMAKVLGYKKGIQKLQPLLI